MSVIQLWLISLIGKTVQVGWRAHLHLKAFCSISILKASIAAIQAIYGSALLSTRPTTWTSCYEDLFMGMWLYEFRQMFLMLSSARTKLRNSQENQMWRVYNCEEAVFSQHNLMWSILPKRFGSCVGRLSCSGTLPPTPRVWSSAQSSCLRPKSCAILAQPATH